MDAFEHAVTFPTQIYLKVFWERPGWLPGSLLRGASARLAQQSFLSKVSSARSRQQGFLTSFAQQGYQAFPSKASSSSCPQQGLTVYECILSEVSSARFPQQGFLSKGSSARFSAGLSHPGFVATTCFSNRDSFPLGPRWGHAGF